MAPIGLAPTDKLLPLIVKVTVEVPPEPVSATDPRVLVPVAKVTLPVGVVVPAVARTVAVNWVEPVCAMLAGLAVRTMATATGDVTVITTEAVAALKFPVGV